jgi:hypothetical protein
MSGRRAEDMTLEELLRAIPGAQARRLPDGSIVVDEAPREPWPQPVAAAFATHRLKEQAAARVRRTHELTDEGRSAREIGRIIASEEGRADRPYDGRVVRSWRAKPRP